jgi:hypothetical protein
VGADDDVGRPGGEAVDDGGLYAVTNSDFRFSKNGKSEILALAPARGISVAPPGKVCTRELERTLPA